MDALLLSDYRQFFCPEQGQGPRNHFTVFTSYFSIIIKSPLSTVYEESLITYHNNRQEMKLAGIRFQVVGGSKSPARAEFHYCSMASTNLYTVNLLPGEESVPGSENNCHFAVA